MASAHTDAFVTTGGTRAVEIAHNVISKYGGVIRKAAADAVAIPPRTKGGYSGALHVWSTQPAYDVTHTMEYGRVVPLFHSITNGPRPIRGQGVALADRPTTSWQATASAHKPTPKGVINIPGYAGHVPHWMPLDGSARPTGSALSKGPPEYKALDRSCMPKVMPLVGYTGHLRHTKESNVCFGTSHWRPQAPPSRAARAALAYERARQTASRPNEFENNVPFTGTLSETYEKLGTWKELSA